MKITDLLRKAEVPSDPLPVEDTGVEVVRETQFPIGVQSPDDARPVMDRDTLMHWSMKLVEKIDQSLSALSQQYVMEPEHVLAMYANIGMYCMGIAESIHNKMGHNHEQHGIHDVETDGRESDAPKTSYHYDPNRGYL